MLEEGATNNTNWKANKMNTYDMDSHDANDSYYDEATDLSTYMGNLGDVDALQHTLQCNQAMRKGRPRPKPKF